MASDPKTLKDELRPLKDILEIVKDKVDRMETFQNVTMQQVRDIKAQQSVMNGKLDNIEERLDDNDTGLAAINRRLEKRLEPLEEDAGRDIPPELKLESLSEPPAQP